MAAKDSSDISSDSDSAFELEIKSDGVSPDLSLYLL